MYVNMLKDFGLNADQVGSILSHNDKERSCSLYHSKLIIVRWLQHKAALSSGYQFCSQQLACLKACLLNPSALVGNSTMAVQCEGWAKSNTSQRQMFCTKPPTTQVTQKPTSCKASFSLSCFKLAKMSRSSCVVSLAVCEPHSHGLKKHQMKNITFALLYLS